MNEQITAILSQTTTKTRKIEQLLQLGLTRRQVADLVTNGNYGFVQNVYKKMLSRTVQTIPASIQLDYTFTRKFGIEIEAYNCTREKLASELRSAGIDVAVEGYNHTTRNHWKLVTDSSLTGNNTFELVSPVLEGEAGLKELEPFYGTEGLGSNERWIYEGSNDLAFVQGQIPFSIYGPWDVTTIRNNYPQFANSYGIMPYPVYEDASGKKSGRVAIPCGSYAFGITRDCRDEKMDAAVAALLYLTGKEASEELYYGIGTYPTNKESLANIPELKEGPAKVLADSLNANEYTRPKQIKYPQLREAFGSILTYMKNRAYYGNDYDLDGYVAQQAQIVDNDQISN